MKRMINSSEDIQASDFNKSSKNEAISIAEALKYVLEDMTDTDFESMMRKCPGFYDELTDFIRYN